MTLLVTGATGFLGGRLVRRARLEGRAVIAMGRDGGKLAALEALGARTVARDLRHPFTPAEADALAGVATIVHCAAHSAPWGPARLFREANLRSAETLAELARILAVPRFIQISTPAVYFRPRDQLGVPEDAPLPAAVNAYAETKALAEAVVLERLGPAATVLRPRGLYGAGDTALLPRLLRAARSGPLPLLRDGQAATDLTHVEDVVDAIGAAERRPPDAPRIYNVSGGEALNIRALIDRVGRALGVPVRWRPVPVPLAMGAARALEAASRLGGWRREPPVTRYSLGILAWSQTLDISRAARELVWRPAVPFEQGLREAIGDLAGEAP